MKIFKSIENAVQVNLECQMYFDVGKPKTKIKILRKKFKKKL